MKDFVEALRSNDVNTRRDAAARIKQSGDPNYVPSLIKSLLDNTEDEWVSIDVAEALGEIGDKRAIPALLDALKSEERLNTWRGEWEKLDEITDKELRYQKYVFLWETLVAEISDLRVAAANALGKIGGEEAVTGLIETLGDKYDSQLREASMNALKRIGTPNALAALAKEG